MSGALYLHRVALALHVELRAPEGVEAGGDDGHACEHRL